MNKEEYGSDDIEISIILDGLLGKNLVLMGMMGSGKSTLGKVISKRLGLDFVDSDREMEQASGLSIKEIIDKDGMDFFRDREGKVVNRILTGSNRVVSLGGGSIIIDEVRDIIKDRAISIWINPVFEVLVRRLRKSRKVRPLIFGLSELGLLERLQQLMSEREQYYRECDLEFRYSDVRASVDMHCYEILKRLEGMFLSMDK